MATAHRGLTRARHQGGARDRSCSHLSLLLCLRRRYKGDRPNRELHPQITVGVGKTHVAQALGHQAVRQGANVRFAKTSRILAELAGGHADRTWDRRMRELIRPDLLILDDFAMRQLSAAQADDLYELVSERQGRSLIITSNRAPSDWYPLFPNPVVAESLLDRLINSSHQVIMNGPSYRPNKRPKGPTEKPGTPANG
ncbi:ATP-binding protein [Streptomyces camelliae]|uniref:ATP-binding protein n=1 Tax=Streptomyces camelliae TaxID=3004093 RepID=A0ABY7PEI6_9ACTN|nr:ATP-binding protein [Streptomyces sp. HUAS 2-6]WBO69035.1 ATP-binding protein [Streptomyces sp. HUAS 2-6]